MLSKHNHTRRVLALLLAVLMTLALLPTTALAGQEDGYHDPAERWMNAVNRTNELDVNATVTYETFHCSACHLDTSFRIWRTPEYTHDGQTAMTRNIRYSDGTLYGGEGTGVILDGTPGVDATYTGYHWTKSCCTACGTLNSNIGSSDYSFGKNVYWLYDCAAEFTEQLDDVVTYAYADAAYHTKSVDGGTYCGTRHTHEETLERHTLHTDVLPQIDKQRFAIVTHCEKCDYADYEFVAAKAVIADYYGVVDGQAHTITVTDLSESGVNAVIRYGNSVDACTMVTPPSYTEEGQYTVYYSVTYSYQGVDMTENGVAYVWLRDDSVPEIEGCGCGCGDPDCDCGNGGDCPHCHEFDCEHGIHNFIFIDTISATCTTLGYDRWFCPICGLFEKRNYVPATGHIWQSVVIREADCEHGGKVLDICQGCGETRVTITEKGEHSWRTYTVEATCTSPGYTLSECSICGERRITNIGAALGHSYQTYTTPATCVTGGMTLHICDRCGQSYADNYTEAKGHRWNTGEIVTEPSCVTEGLKTYTCETCGAVKSETLPATGHKPGPASTCTEAQLCTVCGAVLAQPTGHNYTTTVTQATCDRMGYTTYTCANCGATYRGDYTDAHGHSYTAVVTAPTCTEPGYATYTCTRCGNSYVDGYISPKGHRWDGGTPVTDATCTGDGVTIIRCRDCSAAFLKAVSATGHTPGTPATCTEPQLCTVCGAVLAQAKGHRYSATVTEPTCKTMGYTTYTCADCGDSYRADYVDDLGHDFEAEITPPTCTEEGYTTYTCDRCGESFVTDRTEATGHRWDDGTILVKPTCTGEGLLEFRCTACDKTRNETLPALGHIPGEAATCTEPQLCNVCGAVLARANGHNYTAEVTEPTCEQMGCTIYTCTDCGDRYKADYTDPIGHNYEAAVTEPTCTEAGYTTWTCANCGDSYVDSYAEPMGHAWDEGMAITDATCNGKGVLEHRCTRCDKTYLEAVDATGHTPGAAATCTEPQLCTACGAVLNPAKGHSFEAEVTAPTCLRMGWTTYTCADCGESYKSDYTDPTGHDYVPYVTEPTCTAGGYTTYVCANCGDSFSVRFTAPLGHDWIGTMISAPCCTGDGVVEYTCSRCEERYCANIPATGHTPGNPATCINPQICLECGAVLAFAQGHNYKATVTPPTCEKMGWTTYVCRICGDSYVADYTEPTGHTWDVGTVLIESSCNGEGLVDHRCVVCDYHYLEAVSPVGHIPGAEADCIHPQLCTVCGAVLVQALGHRYETVVTAPTCTEMGYTTYICVGCGKTHKDDYTKPTGHTESDWIIDKAPTADAEGLRHKVCTVCGITLISETMEKLYRTATTDSKGEAVVGAYLVIVTDTNSGNPVPGASVVLNADNTLSIRLPEGRLLDYAAQTTVTVLLREDKAARSEMQPVVGLFIAVSDKNGNYCAEKTNTQGQITVPGSSGVTGPDGTVTFGWIDVDSNRYTITIRISDYENGRPIVGAIVTIGKTGHISVILPDGIDMDAANRIVITLVNQRKAPLVGWIIFVQGDRADENGETDEDGTLILPEIVRKEKHAAYIVGYPDGTFGPERGMTRAEATAIFARLLANKKGDTVVPVISTKFADIPENAWYSGYVRYLNNYGIVYGKEDANFCPDDPITRAEFVAMAVRFFEVYGDGNPVIMEQYAEFTDISDGYWAAQYIKDAAIYGWIRGYGDGTFRATQAITRAEVVTIVNRLLDRTADKAYLARNLRSLNTFSDMDDTHWA